MRSVNFPRKTPTNDDRLTRLHRLVKDGLVVAASRWADDRKTTFRVALKGNITYDMTGPEVDAFLVGVQVVQARLRDSLTVGHY